MEQFFKSKSFKGIIVAFTLLFAFLMRGVYTGEILPFLAGVNGIIMIPINSIASSVSYIVDTSIQPFLNAKNIDKENKILLEENRKLTKQLVDYQILKNENEQYREFLEIKERNTDLVFEQATVIGRSPDAQFGTFAIDVGSFHGIKPRSPVITPDGLVGLVTNVGYNYSEVTTIYNPNLSIGVISSRTMDTGMISGDVELFEKNFTKLGYLTRDSGIATGDIIITSGIGGMLPKGLIVGTVNSVHNETNGLSMYAVIKPSVNIDKIKSVFVIKDFAGKTQEFENTKQEEN